MVRGGPWHRARCHQRLHMREPREFLSLKVRASGNQVSPVPAARLCGPGWALGLSQQIPFSPGGSWGRRTILQTDKIAPVSGATGPDWWGRLGAGLARHVVWEPGCHHPSLLFYKT